MYDEDEEIQMHNAPSLKFHSMKDEIERLISSLRKHDFLRVCKLLGL